MRWLYKFEEHPNIGMLLLRFIGSAAVQNSGVCVDFPGVIR